MPFACAYIRNAVRSSRLRLSPSNFRTSSGFLPDVPCGFQSYAICRYYFACATPPSRQTGSPPVVCFRGFYPEPCGCLSLWCAYLSKGICAMVCACVRFLGEEYPQRPAALPPSLKDAAKVLLLWELMNGTIKRENKKKCKKV